MKFFKTINLTAFEVEYIDQREPKPRTVKREIVVLDGGRISALGRLGIRPAGWISQQFAAQGYTVTTVRKGESLGADVDLSELWQRTAAQIAEQQEGGTAE